MRPAKWNVATAGADGREVANEENDSNWNVRGAGRHLPASGSGSSAGAKQRRREPDRGIAELDGGGAGGARGRPGKAGGDCAWVDDSELRSVVQGRVWRVEWHETGFGLQGGLRAARQMAPNPF